MGEDFLLRLSWLGLLTATVLYWIHRLLTGWHGRKATYLNVVGFGFVLFTYIGVNIFLAGVHGY